MMAANPALLSREFDAVCKQLHVDPREMRFGRQRRRTARLVTAARALFLLRAKQLGATTSQLERILEISRESIAAWCREFRDRGLLRDSRESDQTACQPRVKKNATDENQNGQKEPK